MFKLAYKFSLLFVVVLLTAILFHQFINLPFYWGNPQLAAKSLYLKEQSSQPRAFFIGSSITYHGVIPSVFSELMDEPEDYAFNLGLDGAQPPQTFYVVEELLEKEEPIDYIFFELNSFDQMAPHIFQTTRGKYYYRLDHLWMTIQYFYHSNYLQRTGLRVTHKLGLIAKHGITFLESMLKLGMRKEMIKSLMISVSKTSVEDNGYYPLMANRDTGQVAIDNLYKQLNEAKYRISTTYEEGVEETKYNPVLYDALVDLIKRTAAKDIQFICLLPPFERAFDSPSEMLALFNALPEENRIDLANPNKYSTFYEVANRWEIGHLNDTGARLYTQYLGGEIARKFMKTDIAGLTDSIVLAQNEPKEPLKEDVMPMSKEKVTIKYQIRGIVKNEKTGEIAFEGINVYVDKGLKVAAENGQFAFELTNEVIQQDKMHIRFSSLAYEPLEQIIDFNQHKQIDLDIMLKPLLKSFVKATDPSVRSTDDGDLITLDYLLADILENRASFASAKIESPIPEMELIQGDTLLMNNVLGNELIGDEQDQLTVLPNYYLGTHVVTYEAFHRFLRATERASIEDYDWEITKQPMTNVNWYQAIEYCNWLSKEHGYEPVYTIDKTTVDQSNQNELDTLKWTITPNWMAQGYRLPTETEWAFATNSLAASEASQQVWEWCWDWLGEYQTVVTANGVQSSETGTLRVVQKDIIRNEVDTVSSITRIDMPPFQQELVGFRLCRRAN